MFKELHRDVAVLMASRGVRAFAFSYLNVIFAIYLSQLGYSTVTVGLVISTAYASGAVLTALWGYLSDRFGRKKILILLAALTIVSNLIYLFSITFFSFSSLSSSPMSERGERAPAVKAEGLLIRWSRPCWPRNVLRRIATGFSPPTLLSARLWARWARL
jgi:MFS family permease